MKHRFFTVALAAFPCVCFGADLTGTWKSEFDSQIGRQKYTYTLKQEGDKLIPVITPGTTEAYQKAIDLDPNGTFGAQAKQGIEALPEQVAAEVGQHGFDAF